MRDSDSWNLYVILIYILKMIHPCRDLHFMIAITKFEGSSYYISEKVIDF